MATDEVIQERGERSIFVKCNVEGRTSMQTPGGGLRRALLEGLDMRGCFHLFRNKGRPQGVIPTTGSRRVGEKGRYHSADIVFSYLGRVEKCRYRDF